MSRGLIGKKIGMTGVFNSDGRYIPVTVIQAGPCVVTQIKTIAVDGYNALQLGFGEKISSKVNKPLQGHFKKSGGNCFTDVREVAVDEPESFTLGQNIGPDLFKVGERINIVGTTKGRGFAGVIKRHGFGGGRSSHGGRCFRLPGSIGCSASPSKVIKGKKMPGRYGAEQRTIQGLEVIEVRSEENIILVKGAVPGHRQALVMINKAAKQVKSD